MEDTTPDPWSTWIQNNPGKSVFTPTVAPVNAPRQVEGPVNTRFNEQDAKIETLNRKFEELQATQTQIHNDNTTMRGEVEKAVKNQQEQFTALTKSVDARITQQTEENNVKFGALQSAVESGRRAQEEQFNILRNMLMQSVNTSRKTQKIDGASTPGGGEGD